MFRLLFASVTSAPVRLWVLGDSTAGSPSCRRPLLSHSLTTDGSTNIDFVGTLAAPNCGFTYDGENKGHSGYLVTEVSSGNYIRPQEGIIEPWLRKSNLDVAIIHFGTNDAWNNIAPSRVCDGFTIILGKIRARNPTADVIISQIINQGPRGTHTACPDCTLRVQPLNAPIAQWPPIYPTEGSKIVVERCTGSTAATDTHDGVHPNSNGNAKMAAKFLNPVQDAITAKGGHASASKSI
jgi:lysophospholipase L1-like esterase